MYRQDYFRHIVMYLNKENQKTFIGNLLSALDFKISTRKGIIGLSGLSHKVEFLGIREDSKHVLLVNTGIEEAYHVHKISLDSIPSLEDHWRRQSLLASYDIKAVIEKQGWVCDLLFFRNCFDVIEKLNISSDREFEKYYKEEKLMRSLGYTITTGIDKLEMLTKDELTHNAISIGACFISLDDFEIDRIKEYSTSSDSELIQAVKYDLQKSRIHQFFAPPTDEFLLGIIDKSKNTMEKTDLRRVADFTKSMKHPLSENAIIDKTPFDDPVKVATALEKDKLIEYRAKIIHLTPDGKLIVHKIIKTPQESWIIKVIRALRIPELAGEIIKALKSTQ